MIIAAMRIMIIALRMKMKTCKSSSITSEELNILRCIDTYIISDQLITRSDGKSVTKRELLTDIYSYLEHQESIFYSI